jgi:hypothetical protein
MNSGITSAIFALIGALVGAGATCVVAYMNGHFQARQQQMTNEAAARQLARNACASFLAASDSFIGLARELAVELDARPLSEIPEKLRGDYRIAWSDLVARQAEVEIVAPSAVGTAVTGLRKAVARLGNLIDERCNGSAWSGSYEGALKSVSKARAEFVSVAHESMTGPEMASR